ncbi:MAG: hypothetical protein WB341_13105 [Terracidiphilus sp.]
MDTKSLWIGGFVGNLRTILAKRLLENELSTIIRQASGHKKNKIRVVGIPARPPRCRGVGSGQMVTYG